MKNKHKTYLPSSYRLIFPEGALSADKVGNNTGTKRDNLQGNERRLDLKNSRRPQKVASKSDIAWTQLAVTALTGQPVCCVVIIEGSQFDGVDITGEDIMADLYQESWNFGDKSLHGPGK